LICVDLRNLLESQFGEVECIDEVKTLACQIVFDRIQAACKEYNVRSRDEQK